VHAKVNRRVRAQQVWRVPFARELARKRHREAAGLRGGDELLGICALVFAKP